MSAPAPITGPRRPRVPGWVGRLGGSGVPEATFALSAYLYSQAFPLNDRPVSWGDALVDFLICFFAALTGRWPRVGTLGVGACMLWFGLVDHFSIAWLVFLIPVVSNGAHGRAVLRDIAALLAFALALVKTIPLNNTVNEAIQTVIIWTIIVGLAWATGRTVDRLRRESVRQNELRTASLRSQRRSIARDLHDTVSYATTTMIMRAEQIKLRTGDDPDLVSDLDFIIATGRRSVRELRGMMETLRRNDPELDLDDDAPWRLQTLSDVITDRQRELAAHGRRLDVSVDDRVDSLPNSVKETIGKLIVEATSNMVKHAGTGPCRMIIEVHDTLVEAVFTNPLRTGRDLPASVQGLGIIGARERIEALGGELEATAASGTWILRAQLPWGE